MGDYASELAERWCVSYRFNDGSKEARAIEGAVREALAKAAEVAMESACDCLSGEGWTADDARHEQWCCGIRARAAIRTLGAREGG